MNRLAAYLLTAATAAMAGCGAQAALLGAEKGHLFVANDVLAAPGQTVSLRIRHQSGDLLTDRAGHVVHFLIDGRLYRAAETDQDGIASVTFTPPTPGQYLFTAAFSPNGFADEPPSPVQLRVACLPADTPIMIVDLDHTLVAGGFEQVLIGDPAPLPHSRQVMARLAERFRPVYLTHRPYYFATKSKAWLGRYGYPPGAVLFSDVQGFLKGSEAYKSAALSDLRRTFKQIRIGIGDKPADAKAYHDNGIAAFLIVQPTPADGLKALKELATELAGLPEDVQVTTDWREIERAVLGEARYGRSRVQAQLDGMIRDLEGRTGGNR